ncbi:MAG TPA: GntR family transcriptional regulator [Geminicoccaceae bacterium]|nr:GntR family transcriptional regulator [Geminicoccaceae bacterium]
MAETRLALQPDTPDYRDLSEWVAVKIMNGIRDGDIVPGERLVEHDVAARLGVSRAPVRDALRRLEVLGVVVRRAPRGYFVQTWTERDAMEILLLLDAVINLSVRLAIGRLSAADFAQLEQALAQTRQLVDVGCHDPRRYWPIDMRFHRVIAQASGHRRLLDLIEHLTLPIELTPKSFIFRDDPGFALRQHSALLEALKTNDRDAALACVGRNAREREDEFLREFFARLDGAEPPIAPSRKKPRRKAQPADLSDQPR